MTKKGSDSKGPAPSLPIEVLDRRREAWQRLDNALNELANHPDLARPADVRHFVMILRDLCERIPREANLQEALLSLESEFRAARTRVQQSNRQNDALEWTRSEWRRDSKHYPSRDDFARIYSALVREKYGKGPSARTISERWLKGL